VKHRSWLNLSVPNPATRVACALTLFNGTNRHKIEGLIIHKIPQGLEFRYKVPG
jgi:hypothetical protein